MILYAICAIIVAILSIILFFKIWGMTNDVKEIKDRLARVLPTEEEKMSEELKSATMSAEEKAIVMESDFKIGEMVRYAPMNRVMIVKSIHEDGKIECVSYKKNGTEEFEGLYDPAQIEHYKAE